VLDGFRLVSEVSGELDNQGYLDLELRAPLPFMNRLKQPDRLLYLSTQSPVVLRSVQNDSILNCADRASRCLATAKTPLSIVPTRGDPRHERLQQLHRSLPA